MAITGTTTITGLGTGFNGCYRELRFASALTLTHSSSLKLPGNVNITTAAGDIAAFRCTGSGVWELAGYSRPNAITDAAYVTKTGANTITGTLTNTSNNYVGGAADVTLAPGGPGNVRLRPNGAASETA